MSSYINAKLRRVVRARAQALCEYCLIHEEDTFSGCHLDHIISEKHGGLTVESNLAYACAFCNQFKGADIGSIHHQTGRFIRFFKPRADRWRDHFSLIDFRFEPGSPIGEVTAEILQLNHEDRIAERELLRSLHRYPRVAARRLMGWEI